MSREVEKSNFRAFLSYRGKNFEILTYDGKNLISYLREKIMESFEKQSQEPGALYIYFDKRDIDPNEASMKILADHCRDSDVFMYFFTGDFIENVEKNFCLKEFEIFKERFTGNSKELDPSVFFRLVYFEPNKKMQDWCATHFGNVSGGFDLYFYNKEEGINEVFYEYEEHKIRGQRRIDKIAKALLNKYNNLPTIEDSIYIYSDDRSITQEVNNLKTQIESKNVSVHANPIFNLNSNRRINKNSKKISTNTYMLENSKFIIGVFLNDELTDIKFVLNKFNPELSDHFFVITTVREYKKFMKSLNELNISDFDTDVFFDYLLNEYKMTTLKDIQNRFNN